MLGAMIPSSATELEIAGRLALAGLTGLAVGIEREWSGHASGPHARFAGVRTFLLLGLVGGMSGVMVAAGWAALAVTLTGGAAVLAVVAYAVASEQTADRDGTTETAALLVLSTGALCGLGYGRVGSGIAVVAALALAEKSRIQNLVTRIGDIELRAALRFAVLALVVLPLLPGRSVRSLRCHPPSRAVVHRPPLFRTQLPRLSRASYRRPRAGLRHHRTAGGTGLLDRGHAELQSGESIEPQVRSQPRARRAGGMYRGHSSSLRNHLRPEPSGGPAPGTVCDSAHAGRQCDRRLGVAAEPRGDGTYRAARAESAPFGHGHPDGRGIPVGAPRPPLRPAALGGSRRAGLCRGTRPDGHGRADLFDGPTRCQKTPPLPPRPSRWASSPTRSSS